MSRKGAFNKFIIVTAIVSVMAFFIYTNINKLMQIFYPFEYREIVLQASEEFEIDPFLILAVMRAESKFNPEAVSSKGARGLMQIMPDTGRWIAQQQGIDDFDTIQLFEAETNIRFGAWYLRFLSNEFNQRLTVVLASYNAGPGKVKDWLSDDLWNGTITNVEDIPFPETRNYVQRVSKNLQLYTELYGETIKKNDNSKR
ncbi:MAG: lytic transglycosylase domain-containing protein [Bacillota bacterium]|nr:lytic transglycosylase domain-containing protein [Bacillota bacterium]